MAREVIWSEPAIDDVVELVEFIARDSEFYAELTEKKIHDAVKSLHRFPFRSRIIPEFGDPKIREIFVHSYRLVFEISEYQIIVHAVLHSSRRLRNISNN